MLGGRATYHLTLCRNEYTMLNNREREDLTALQIFQAVAQHERLCHTENTSHWRYLGYDILEIEAALNKLLQPQAPVIPAVVEPQLDPHDVWCANLRLGEQVAWLNRGDTWLLATFEGYDTEQEGNPPVVKRVEEGCVAFAVAPKDIRPLTSTDREVLALRRRVVELDKLHTDAELALRETELERNAAQTAARTQQAAWSAVCKFLGLTPLATPQEVIVTIGERVELAARPEAFCPPQRLETVCPVPWHLHKGAVRDALGHHVFDVCTEGTLEDDRVLLEALFAYLNGVRS